VRTRLVRFAAYGVITAAVVVATTAYVALDKTVTVSVDGVTSTVHTYAGSVAGVLNRAGIAVGEHDSVTPAVSSRVHDGSTIAIRRGRLLQLTVDGQARSVWVTADDVADALRQAGLRTTGAVVSADRSERVPLTGMSIDVALPHTITVQADGASHVIVTTRATLAAALAEAGIAVNPADQVSTPLDVRPFDGMAVVIVRVTSNQVLESSPLPFTTVTKNDPTLLVGTKQVGQAGVNGTLVRTYQLTFADGAQTSKVLVAQQVTVPPVQQVILVGTKPKPPPPVYHPKADGLNWAALARCESGGRANAVDPPFYGMYQFRIGTWQAVGGHGLPSDASAAEQTYRAQLLYQRSSWQTQWPVCGHLLFS
jgi:uncharacterized protein YabE (DUF348 family)